MRVIWEKGKDNIHNVQLVQGNYYWLEFEKAGSKFKDLELPVIRYIQGKRCVITDMVESDDLVKFKVYIAQNPFWVVPLIYALCGIAISIGLIVSGDKLVRIVEVGAPSLAITVIGAIALLWLLRR